METPLTHAVPPDTAPSAAVVVNNLACNKLECNSPKKIEQVADGRDGGNPMSTAMVKLVNTVPSRLMPDNDAGPLRLRCHFRDEVRYGDHAGIRPTKCNHYREAGETNRQRRTNTAIHELRTRILGAREPSRSPRRRIEHSDFSPIRSRLIWRTQRNNQTSGLQCDELNISAVVIWVRSQSEANAQAAANPDCLRDYRLMPVSTLDGPNRKRVTVDQRRRAHWQLTIKGWL